VFEISAKSSWDVGFDIHITPRFHWEGQIGLSGIGGTAGYIHDGQSYDVSVRTGWGTIGLSYIAINYGPVILPLLKEPVEELLENGLPEWFPEPSKNPASYIY